MKTTILITSIAMTMMAISCTQAAPEGALEKLQKAVSEGKYMYAHQDDLCYGHFWEHPSDIQADPADRSDVKSVCGDYPAVVGFELGGIEMADSASLDGVSYEFLRKAAEAHIARGGLVTISWHPRNPLTGGDAWDVSSDQVVTSVLTGGENEAKFELWLDRVAEFLGSIRNPDGSQAQIIFRPWHEHMASWFWWGGTLCTAEQYKALWLKTYDNIVGKHGITELVWAYSPDAVQTPEEYMERYPGDDKVDVLGVDIYEYKGNTEAFVESLNGVFSYLTALGKEHGKVLALTETGSEGIPNPAWWTEVLAPLVEQYPISYALTWRNACDRPEHFYGPFPGHACAEDFVKFHDSEKTLFLEDIK